MTSFFVQRLASASLMSSEKNKSRKENEICYIRPTSSAVLQFRRGRTDFIQCCNGVVRGAFALLYTSLRGHLITVLGTNVSPPWIKTRPMFIEDYSIHALAHPTEVTF